MADLNEIQALGSSLRGAMRSAADLSDVASRIQGASAQTDLSETDLDDLQRLSLANAVAAQALRGLVESMLRRRGRSVPAGAGGEGGIDE